MKNITLLFLIFFTAMSCSSDVQEQPITADSISFAIQHSAAVKSVNLYQVKELKFVDEFFDIPNLEQLSIYDCGIRDLPKSLSKAQNLKFLNLSNNELTRLPSAIYQLDKLITLNLFLNPLEVGLSDSIGQLVHLRQLFLDTCNVATLPKGIGKLSELQELSLTMNPIKTLPTWFSELQTLEILGMPCTEWFEDSSTVNTLSSLKKLRRIRLDPACTVRWRQEGKLERLKELFPAIKVD